MVDQDTPPNAKRAKTDVETVLFLISRYPWKETVMLPCMQSFTINEVKTALKKKNVTPPSFPKGEFHVITAELDYQVAIFKYHQDAVAGCRTTNSKQHKALPLPIKSHKNVAEFTKEPHKLRLGYRFLWGVNQPYKVCDRKVNLFEIEVPDSASVAEPEV